jgi:hypothetical protein
VLRRPASCFEDARLESWPGNLLSWLRFGDSPRNFGTACLNWPRLVVISYSHWITEVVVTKREKTMGICGLSKAGTAWSLGEDNRVIRVAGYRLGVWSSIPGRRTTVLLLTTISYCIGIAVRVPLPVCEEGEATNHLPRLRTAGFASSCVSNKISWHSKD